VVVPWRAQDLVHCPLRRQARRPQLKRDPLGRSHAPMISRSSHLARAMLALLLVATVHACQPAPPAVRRIAGCYEVAVGAWNREALVPPPSYVPPDTVWLHTAPVMDQAVAVGYEVGPNIFEWEPPGHRDIPPTWQLIGDTARIIWSNGFAGVRLFVVTTGSRLTGRAEAFTDVVRQEQLPNGTVRQLPWPTARIRMRRVKCPKPASA